ncbi:unnamed protein product, partial [Gongylonema pulchrum]|uniref:ApaG domain-containing protein n=1 Tax=Gongylonema pulchrum TaxID=637853 RepID=A0A183ESS1_9BILA
INSIISIKTKLVFRSQSSPKSSIIYASWYWHESCSTNDKVTFSYQLMADQDNTVVKHQIPHITTDPPSSGESSPPVKVPELLKGTVEM